MDYTYLCVRNKSAVFPIVESVVRPHAAPISAHCHSRAFFPRKAIYNLSLNPYSPVRCKRPCLPPVLAVSELSSSDSSPTEPWEEPIEWDHYTVMDVLQGVIPLVIAERGIAATVQSVKFPFPAPVLMLAAIAAVMAVNNQFSVALYEFHAGAVAFFDTWMPMFFVPSVAGITLAPVPAGADLLKAIALLGFTYAFHLWGSAKLAVLVGSSGSKDPISDSEKIERIRRSATVWGKAMAVRSAQALDSVANHKAASKDVRQVANAAYVALAKVADKIQLPKKLPVPPDNLAVTATALGVALLTPLTLFSQTAQNPLLMTPGFLFLTIGLFSAAKRLPAPIRKWLSPTVAAGLTIASLTAYYGAVGMNPASWRQGVSLYKRGAGVILASLIGPAVASLGFKVHTQRALLEKSLKEMALVCLLMTPIGLLATAIAGRLLGASPIITASLLPATTTLGLAREMGPLLGSNPGLVVAGVTIAGTVGISTARQLLGHWKVDGPLNRGMAVGAASHTLGASAIAVEEPQAAAVAGLTLALKGSLSVIALSVPQFRQLLLAIANP